MTLEASSKTGLFVSFCNASLCNTLALYGSSPDGHLWYLPGLDCGSWGRNCRAWAQEPVVPPGSLNFVVPGPVTLVFERRPSSLRVWLPDHPDKAVSVADGGGSDLLRIRPDVWVSDMPVDFDYARFEAEVTKGL
ncbi:uncharacterized protein LOC117648352 [Thrips palmi]|uniref:Uncharacterized protein LOC117648352 n=1 Tax=Thrips palmi TaxID=161013 RepID=A0A6P8ZR00_THRPL|nr:uncharacterized protein LOC117648352 [Thrips palmi]